MANPIIYKATFPNGKHYIGQTIDLDTRKRAHKTTRKCPYFATARDKYGFDNIAWTIMLKCESREHANKAEQVYIAMYQTTDKRYGYNDQTGGDCSEHSEAAKRKISQSLKGKQQHWLGRKHTEATKCKMSLAAIGKPKSEAHRRALSVATKRYWQKKREVCNERN